MTGVVVLGSTGSIGRQTLEVIAAHRDHFSLVGLAAGRRSDQFAAQLAEWPGARAWCNDGRPADLSRERWAPGGLEELATMEGAALIVVATTGMTALPAVLAALRSGRRVALANKETLVTGGHLVERLVADLGGDPLERLRPIDSEHSAIWQCLAGERLEDVARLVLTASGGPFRDRPAGALEDVTPAQALAHPNWRMGPKITVDSATLVNKAFEAIEAKWLYRLPYDRIQAVIHPQSVVHSLVEFTDGSFKAQLGLPDMRLPIQYALTYPRRLPSPARRSAPQEWGSLQFESLDDGRFPAYDAVRAAAAAGGNRGAILNAADEAAVAGFLAGTITFPRIAGVIAEAVERWGDASEPDLEGIVTLDGEVRAALSVELGLGWRRLMDVLGTILAFIGVLVVLVLVHELGHFVVAKRAGITVQEFGVGFPPRIGSVVWHGTRYSVNWIPLGGFVKMLGEDGEAEADKMRKRGLSDAAIDKAMEGAFNRKPIWVRIIVLVAGVAMNFLLASALFAVALSLPGTEGRGPLTVTEIQAGSPAVAAGLEVGDVIVAADGRTFQVSRELTAYVRSRAGHIVDLTVRRDGNETVIPVTPRSLSDAEEAKGMGAVGFSYEPDRFVEVPPAVGSPAEAAWKGITAAGDLAVKIPGGLATAVAGLLGLAPDAGTAVGPIGIASETGRVLRAPLVSQLIFVGILSVNLAVLNVLPFPPLDGGRIAVTVVEAVRRRRLPAEREALVYLTGFMVLILLVILISIRDVANLIGG